MRLLIFKAKNIHVHMHEYVWVCVWSGKKKKKKSQAVCLAVSQFDIGLWHPLMSLNMFLCHQSIQETKAINSF